MRRSPEWELGLPRVHRQASPAFPGDSPCCSDGLPETCSVVKGTGFGGGTGFGAWLLVIKALQGSKFNKI